MIKQLKNPGEEGPLQFEGKDVKTRLDETVLRDIANRTGGEYLPARTSNLPLGSLLPDILAKQNADSPEHKTTSVPVQQQRQAWFLWPALGLLSATLFLRDRRGRNRHRGARPTVTDASTIAGLSGVLSRCVLLMFAAAAFLQLAAVGPEDDWIRQGNAAFAGDKLELALSLYEQAEGGTTDPGLVAFNKAAVLYRMKRYREAELHYLRCLEDRQAPPARQTHALFNLGTALLRQAGDKNIATLDRAIDAFSACLTQRDLSPRLATDAQYNLELARWLRFQAGPPPPQPPTEDQNPSSEPKKKETKKWGNDSNPDNSGTPSTNGEENKGQGTTDDPKSAKTLGQKLAGSGSLQVLPDADKLVKLAPEDAARHLEELARRLSEQRRHHAGQRPAVAAPFKDW